MIQAFVQSDLRSKAMDMRERRLEDQEATIARRRAELDAEVQQVWVCLQFRSDFA